VQQLADGEAGQQLYMIQLGTAGMLRELKVYPSDMVACLCGPMTVSGKLMASNSIDLLVDALFRALEASSQHLRMQPCLASRWLT
jgi:hypothetical protein